MTGKNFVMIGSLTQMGNQRVIAHGEGICKMEYGIKEHANNVMK